MSKTSQISDILKKQIESYNKKTNLKEIGSVISVGDGIALISGLENAMAGEILSFGKGKYGLVLNLEENVVGAALLGSSGVVKEEDIVKKNKKVISVPVGDALLGRVVNTLGKEIDGFGPIKTTKKRAIFKIAPGVMTRESVNQPLETGIITIDSMIPIGKGQRELIIGDRQTGKTAIAVDTIINQKGKNVKCIYVAIGQKNSSVAQVVRQLKKTGAMKYTTVVNASASDADTLQYLAPYTGIAIAEEWMSKGDDVLIVYDDLTKHAISYRTVSLLLRRPPGREAFPGDVFYLHSQLLERAAKMNMANGGGSITAFPIIETQAGDISAYIPTNVISITDGQIFTMTNLFNAGQRPAIDPGFSVSRVGSAAQIKAIKEVSSSLKLELAQYNEMEAFAHFGSDLDKETKKILNHGKKVLEILKQKQYSPINQIDQSLILLALKERLINPIPLEKISDFKRELIDYFQKNKAAKNLWIALSKQKAFNPEIKIKAFNLIRDFVLKFIKRIPNYNEKNYPSIPELKTLKKEKRK